MKYKALTLIMPIILMGAIGCNTWERTVFQTLAASQVVINQAQTDYESGTALPHSAKVYNLVNLAKEAQVNAVNALVVYEQLKATSASASTLAQQQQVVTTLLAAIPTAIANVKALYTSAKTISYLAPLNSYKEAA